MLRYGGSTATLSHKVGFTMIQLALKNAGRSLSAVQMERLKRGGTAIDLDNKDRASMVTFSTKQPIGSPDDIKRYLKELDSYDELIRRATENRETTEVQVLRDERDKLWNQVSKLTKPGGAIKNLGSDESRAAKRVETNIRRAKDEISVHMPALGNHLRTYLNAASSVIYLDTSTRWSFE